MRVSVSGKVSARSEVRVSLEDEHELEVECPGR